MIDWPMGLIRLLGILLLRHSLLGVGFLLNGLHAWLLGAVLGLLLAGVLTGVLRRSHSDAWISGVLVVSCEVHVFLNLYLT